MIVNPPGRDPGMERVHLGSSLLDTVQSYNYLGITIDCYLNFGKFRKKNGVR